MFINDIMLTIANMYSTYSAKLCGQILLRLLKRTKQNIALFSNMNIY